MLLFVAVYCHLWPFSRYQNGNKMAKSSTLTPRETTRHGRSVWEVDIPKALTGKRVRRFASTKEAALRAANEYLEENRLHGSALAGLSQAERFLILKYRNKGLTVAKMDAILSAAPGESPALNIALHDYLKTKDGLSDGHTKTLKSQFKKISLHFHGRTVASLRPGELETFLHQLGGCAVNYFRALRAFLNYAVRHDWTEENPILKVPTPERTQGDRIILNKNTMQRLLKVARRENDEPVFRLLVFGGFLGLRYSEILRLDCADITKNDVFIQKMKTQKRGIRERYVTISKNAKKWISLMKLPKSGPLIDINERNLRIHRERIVKLARTTWAYNVLRRSFGSYHLAAYENPGLTATQMGHADAETTVSKYRAARRKADGLDWFNIEPT